MAIKYSLGLEKFVNAYFDEHPELNGSYNQCPTEKLIATISRDVYQLLYRNFKLKELYKKAGEG